MTDELLQNHDAGILRLTLNRPDRRNALNTTLITSLTSALQAAEVNRDIRCVILTGTSPAFCAGLDLDEVRTNADHDGCCDVSHLLELYETISQLSLPVLAAVNGPAVAGGAALITTCALAICTPAARFGYPGIRQGITAPIVIPPLLQAVSLPRARHLLLTGELIDANTMHAWGIVTEIVPPDQLLGRAQALAQHIAATPRNAIARTKTDIATISNQTADAETAAHLSLIRTIHVPPQIRKPGSD